MSIPAAAHLTFASLAVGQEASFERILDERDVQAFAAVSGDHHPLHTDAAYAARTRFGKNIVHGLLTGSLFSTLVGMHLPGESCVYVSQSLHFRQPVVPGTPLVVRGRIIAKQEATRLITLRTEIVLKERGVVAVDGEARVHCLF